MNNYSYQMSNQLEEINPHFTFSKSETASSHNISDEIMPLVRKLISLCEEKGFFIKIINRSTFIRKSLINDLSFDFLAAYEATKHLNHLSYQNFGLAFGIGIYESSASGKLKYLDHEVLYDKVGKIGESIGLTWASNHQSLKHLRYFEFRPQWAKNMSDTEMMNELSKRNLAKISLIDIIEKN